MSITSFSFIAFLFVCLLLYYILPKKYQWIVLLAASAVFYLISSLKGAIYVLLTASSVYAATRIMQSISDKQKTYLKDNKDSLSKEEKNTYKAKNKKKRKTIMLCALFFELAFLCVFKYAHFAVDQVNNILSTFNTAGLNNSFNLIVPLGISFYTFQSVGYLVDVYLGQAVAEKNYFKVLLFVSFFPQITQGPISDFNSLSAELYGEHGFEYRNFSYGTQRMLWGFFKKMVVADMLTPYVNSVAEKYTEYTWAALAAGTVLYTIREYADFSGYMDIMCGYCETLGIRLTENFERPFFSKSLAEFWRRWHISLGAWLRKYIYYPVTMSKWDMKIAKKTGKPLISAAIALVFVWFTTGLWHGANWNFILWGLLNGVIIIFSLFAEPVYEKVRVKLKVNNSSFFVKLFRTARTSLIFALLEIITQFGTISEGFGFWKRLFTVNCIPRSFSDVLPFVTGKINFLVITAGIAIMIAVSVLQRKKQIRDYTAKIPVPVRSVMFAGLVVIILIYGVPASMEGGGFMYAQF